MTTAGACSFKGSSRNQLYMNSSVPLCRKSTRCSLLNTEENYISCALDRWKTYFLVSSPSSISLFRYITDQKFQLIGHLFWVRTETGEKFSILRPNQQLFDFPSDVVCGEPNISADTEISTCEHNFIPFYHLLKDTLLVVSASGRIAVVLLGDITVYGCVLPFVCSCSVYKWVGSASDSSILGLSDTALTLIQVNNGISQCYTCSSAESEFYVPVSFFFSRTSLQETSYTLLFFFDDCQDVFLISTGAQETLEVKRVQEKCLARIPFCPIQTLLLCPTSCITFTVFVGRYEISLCGEVLGVSLPVLRVFNAAGVPYCFACHYCANDGSLASYLCVCRKDGVFEYYSISLDPSQFRLRIKNEFVGALPSSTVSICICSGELLFLLSSYGSSTISRWEKVGMCVEMCEEETNGDTVLLAELALIGDTEYGMSFISSSGECILVTDSRKTVVARVRHPKSISALTVVQRKNSLFCVLGSSSGSVMFFKNNSFLAQDFFAHFEAVSRIIFFEVSLSFFPLFLCISEEGKTLTLHREKKYEKIFLASSHFPIRGYDVEPSKELLFLYSDLHVGVWRISDGEMESTFPFPSALPLCTLSHSSLNRGLRLIQQRFCSEGQFSFSISVDRLVSILRKTGSVSREMNVALTLALGSCALCMKKYPLNDRFMHAIDRMGFSIRPTMSLENYLIGIFLEVALFEYPSQKQHSIQACETVFSLVTGLVSKFALAVPEHSLLAYYQKFQHWTCSPFVLSRVHFPVIVNLVSRVEMLERFCEVLKTLEGKKEDEMVDFIGFSLTVHNFCGFISAALPIWRISFEGNPQVEQMSKLLTSQAMHEIQALEKVSLREVELHLRLLVNLSETFWLEKEKERKQWLLKVFELLSLKASSIITKGTCFIMLERIASGDMYQFYIQYLPWICREKPCWRKVILDLQKRLLKNYSLESYNAPYPLFKLLSILSDAKMFKLEKRGQMEHSVDMMAWAAVCLPNVALHRTSQTLAVGLRDGCVHMFHLSSRTTSSFVAHQDAILCIAYNECAVNCEEIATISEKMHHIKIWRAKSSNGNFLVDFLFSGSNAAKFSRVKTILLQPPDQEVTALMSQYTTLQCWKDGSSFFMHPCPFFLHCELKWIDYGTLQLSTPWSGTKLFTV